MPAPTFKPRITIPSLPNGMAPNEAMPDPRTTTQLGFDGNWMLSPTGSGYDLWSNPADGGGDAGNQYGSWRQSYDSEGNIVGDPVWEQVDRSNGFLGDNIRTIGPLLVGGAAALGGGLFAGLGGASTGTGAAVGGTAMDLSSVAVAGVEGAASQAATVAQASILQSGGTMAAATAAADAAVAAVSSGASIVDAIAIGVQSAWNSIPSAAKQALGSVLRNIVGDQGAQQIGRALSNAIGGGLELAGAADIANRTRDLGNELATEYNNLGTRAADDYTNAAQVAATSYAGVGQQAADRWNTLGTTLGSDLRTLAGNTADAWRTLGANSADRWRQGGTEVQGMFDSAATGARDDWNAIGSNFQGQYNDLGAQGRQDYTNLGQTFNPRYAALGSTVQGMFDTVGAAGNTRLTGVGDEYEGKFADAGKRFGAAYSNLGSEYEGKASGIAGQAKAMAGSFTPFAVTTNLGTFDDKGKWTLNPENQAVADAATGVAKKSFDEAGKFDLGNIRQQEYDIMQSIFSPQRERDRLALEARQRAQGRLGLQSLSDQNSIDYTDPTTGTKYRVGANPFDVALAKGFGEADRQAYLEADDNALKRYTGLIGAGNSAMETPIALNDAGIRAGTLAGDLGTRAFDARRSAADLYMQGMFKGLDYGFEGKGKGIGAEMDMTTAGLNAGYDSSMEGARFENTQAVTGATRNADLMRTGLDTEYADTRAGIDYGLGAQRTGIDTALASARTGQTTFDGLTRSGIDAYGDRLNTGLQRQDTADTTGLQEDTRLNERAIDEVARATGKGIEEVRNATNKGYDAYKDLWETGKQDQLRAIENGIKQKFASDREALRALSQLYASASRQMGGMFGDTSGGVGATIQSAIGAFASLFRDSGMSEAEVERALGNLVDTASSAYEDFGLETDLNGLFGGLNDSNWPSFV